MGAIASAACRRGPILKMLRENQNCINGSVTGLPVLFSFFYFYFVITSSLSPCITSYLI